MVHLAFYEYCNITYDDIVIELKSYIKSGDIDTFVKDALNEIGTPDFENCSIRYYAMYIRLKLLNIIKNNNV